MGLVKYKIIKRGKMIDQINKHIFPKASDALNYDTTEKIKLKINNTYLDGFDRKIKIYNRIAWKGCIFYVGKYINPNTGKLLDNLDKNAECKFSENGHHFLYSNKEWNIIKEL